MRKIEVVPHDPAWSREFAGEARRIRDALGDVVAAVHHIGSTAIPGFPAKPVIDICLEVRGLGLLDQQASEMVRLGYQALGEYGIPERRFFLQDDPKGVRTHHAHAFETGSWGVKRHVAFRDYMIAHPPAAEAYGQLKEELLGRHSGEEEPYIEGKGPFIREHEARAVDWAGIDRKD